jgi:methylmalonyl-CoA mutase C-terminal domain/subunit
VERKIRVLVAKPGLDGHDVGAKVIAQALRDAGMEVIYTGLHQTVEQIVVTASQEDVDVIGLSILSGAHIPIAEKLMKKLKENAMDEVLVVMGGNIPAKDNDALKVLGIKGVFATGARFETVVDFIRNNVR